MQTNSLVKSQKITVHQWVHDCECEQQSKSTVLRSTTCTAAVYVVAGCQCSVDKYAYTRFWLLQAASRPTTTDQVGSDTGEFWTTMKWRLLTYLLILQCAFPVLRQYRDTRYPRWYRYRRSNFRYRTTLLM